MTCTTREEKFLRLVLGRRLFASLCPTDLRFLLHYVTEWLYILDDDGRSFRFYAALESTEEGDG